MPHPWQQNFTAIINVIKLFSRFKRKLIVSSSKTNSILVLNHVLKVGLASLGVRLHGWFAGLPTSGANLRK